MLPSEPVSADSSSREAALAFLFGRINYEQIVNVPYRTREFKLDRMRQLLDRLGNPERDLPIVHIAGTKGKGSTAAMVASILQVAGRRTGVFNSPHLDRLEERMMVAGEPCSAEELVELVDRLRPTIEEMDREAARGDTQDEEEGPTYFEITTAMALLHFARRGVDAAVLEVGLGGRLDSTNVCRPRVCVITNISFDHTQQLGNTLASIAREKAGIIKPGVPVVSGVTEEEPRDVIREISHQHGCRLIELGSDFDFDYRPPRDLQENATCGRMDFRYHPRHGDGHGDAGEHFTRTDLPLALLGRHQAANAAVALAALAELRRGGWEIAESAEATGLAKVNWPARVEVVARRPAVVLDGAHNRASIRALVDTLEESFSVQRRLLVFATSEDKDIDGMLRLLLDRFDRVVFTHYADNPRAAPPAELAKLARQLTGNSYTAYDDPAEAWAEVRRSAEPDDLICVTGSFFIVGDIRRREF